MCLKSRIIINHPDGYLASCQCGIFSLSFKNIYLELTLNELNSFKEYIKSVNIDYWQCELSCHPQCKRKIPIPTSQINLMLVFTKEEFISLKDIVFVNQNKLKNNLRYKLLNNYNLN